MLASAPFQGLSGEHVFVRRPSRAMSNHDLILVLFEISLIIGFARLMGGAFRRLGQPPASIPTT